MGGNVALTPGGNDVPEGEMLVGLANVRQVAHVGDGPNFVSNIDNMVGEILAACVAEQDVGLVECKLKAIDQQGCGAAANCVDEGVNIMDGSLDKCRQCVVGGGVGRVLRDVAKAQCEIVQCSHRTYMLGRELGADELSDTEHGNQGVDACSTLVAVLGGVATSHCVTAAQCEEGDMRRNCMEVSGVVEAQCVTEAQ
ncbi:hypothetical protein SESBI_38725 [Sesbania bispinosa]|nr:hypothetical protein SESBI_38725 [Sesbania bispinosa]